MQGRRRLRVLVGKAGLDGHDRGARVVACALRDAGMEVIYTGLRASPEMIVATAMQESIDVIGLSVLSGAHMGIAERTIALLRAEGLDVPIVMGGVIPLDDRRALLALGVRGVLGQEASLADIVALVESLASDHEASITDDKPKETSTADITADGGQS